MKQVINSIEAEWRNSAQYKAMEAKEQEILKFMKDIFEKSKESDRKFKEEMATFNRQHNFVERMRKADAELERLKKL